jgi:hypothetical protein
MEHDFYWDFVLNIKSNKELIRFTEKNKKFFSKYDWLLVTKSDYFNINMIEKYADDLDWQYLTSFYQLPEKLLEEYVGFVDWYSVSAFQNISLKFIKKYEDKLSFDKLTRNEHIRYSVHLKEVEKMYEERKDKPKYQKVWTENFHNSMFKPSKSLPTSNYSPVEEKKEVYTLEKLAKLSKQELKDILQKLNIRVYYHDTLDMLKQKILQN